MSNPAEPTPVSIVPDARPTEVVIISHSPLFYWWPVWVVGFLMAGLSWLQDQRVAFVPPGTVAERQVQVPGIPGPRDILVAPEGRSLPTASDSAELSQPRLRMAESNNPGIIWTMTLCLVIVVTHVQMRGVWSLVVAGFLVFATVLLAFLGLWDPILHAIGVIDIHINAFGYLSISLFLFVIWLLMFLVFDRVKYMIFTRGRLRVRRPSARARRSSTCAA